MDFNHWFLFKAESQESSSDSPSLSSNSFISAMSSQEDITLVNLHMQVNKPIIDSPLLMASYVSHLAHVTPKNWANCCLPLGADAFSTPLFQQNEDGGLSYIGQKLVPHFNTYSNWREIRVVSHSDTGITTSSMHNNHPWDPNVTVRSSTETGSHVESKFCFSFTHMNVVLNTSHSRWRERVYDITKWYSDAKFSCCQI